MWNSWNGFGSEDRTASEGSVIFRGIVGLLVCAELFLIVASGYPF